MLVRKTDWQDRLVVYMRAAHSQPYKRGANDCVAFALGAVEAMTGTRLLPGLDTTYKTRKEARDVLASTGFYDLLGYATSIARENKLESIDPDFSQFGDVALVESPEFGQALAIRWVGGFATKSVGRRGLRRAKSAVLCWRLPTWEQA